MKEVEEKLTISLQNGEVEIMGNRPGLKYLGEICLGLSELSDEEAKTPANHYHFEETLNSADEGSVPMIITCKPDL